MLAASVDGPFRVLLYLITLENDVIYILTVREDVIIRYVKVMRSLHLFSLRLMSTFSIITLVLEIITSSLTVDL